MKWSFITEVSILFLLDDLREKVFQESVVAKVFLVKLSKARTVTLEQLVAMFSPLDLL